MRTELRLLKVADAIRRRIGVVTFCSPYVCLGLQAGEITIRLDGYRIEELEENEDHAWRLLPASHPAWREIIPIWQLLCEIECAYEELRPYRPLVAHLEHQLGPVVVAPECRHRRRDTHGVGDPHTLTLSRPLAESVEDLINAIRRDLSALISKLQAELAEDERHSTTERLRLAEREQELAQLLRFAGIEYVHTPLVWATWRDGDTSVYADGFPVGQDIYADCISWAERAAIERELDAIAALARKVQTAEKVLRRSGIERWQCGPVSISTGPTKVRLNQPLQQSIDELLQEIDSRLVVDMLGR